MLLPDYLDAVHVGDACQMPLPDHSVALAVTSPPYNVGKEYDEDLTLDEYRAFLRAAFREVWRVLEPGGRVAVNIANVGRKPYVPLASYLAADMERLGFLPRGEIIWVKGRAGGCAWGSWQSASNPSLRDGHEYIQVYSKTHYARQRVGLNTITADDFLDATQSVWHISPASARRIGHPAPFPVELPRRLIELYSYRDDVVLDPFAGSGTTGVAALDAGRRFVGFDLNAGYVEAANARLRNTRRLME